MIWTTSVFRFNYQRKIAHEPIYSFGGGSGGKGYPESIQKQL